MGEEVQKMGAEEKIVSKSADSAVQMDSATQSDAPVKADKTAMARSNAWIEVVVFAIIGAAVFLIIFGVTPLDVTNDRWILNHYVEVDIVQHYAGWMAFRDSPWQFPLGAYELIGEGVITYSDSIPWVAIFCKLFREILPGTFQYFGIYVLLCYILQGISGGLILRLFTKRRLTVFLGTVLLCCSPIMMERAFRHTALASHYLILFALYLYLNTRNTGKLSWGYLLLSVLAIGIHPYFLPMVLGIMLANVLYLLPSGRKCSLTASGQLLGTIAVTVAAGYLIGALGTSSYSMSGYGYLSLNLNAIYNPISCGSIKWSWFIPASDQTLGNYDGFNYLGLGVLSVLPVLLYQLAIHFRTILRQYWGLLLVCICLFLFAVTNVVTFNDTILIELPLPESVMDICNIFRASARMFYPIYYLIVIGVLCVLDRIPYGAICTALILVVQVVDISPGIMTKHSSFDSGQIELAFEENVWYHSETLDALLEHIDRIRTLQQTQDVDLAAWSLKNGIETDVTISNRTYNETDTDRYAEAVEELITNPDERTAYVVTDIDLNIVDEIYTSISEDYEVIRACDYFYFIVCRDWEIPGEEYIPSS